MTKYIQPDIFAMAESKYYNRKEVRQGQLF